MNSKEKKFRINIVDILVIVLVLAAVAVVGVSKLRSDSASAAEAKTVKITFYAEEISDSAVKSVQPGNTVSDSITEVVFGTCEEPTISESVSYIASQQDDGSYSYIATSRPGYKSVEFSCITEGAFSDIGVAFDGFIYGVGHTLELHVGNTRFTARVKDIVIVEG